MNKIKLSMLSIISSISLGIVAFGVHNEPVKISAYQNGDAATYYSSIDKYDSGSTLTSKLNTLNTSKRRNLIPYNSLMNYFEQTDPGARSGEVTAFYSGTSAKYNKKMNREHVWPYSKLYLNGDDRVDEGKNEVEQDLHMVRPAMISENTGRGNSFFTMPDGEGWDPGSLGNESYRGDSARIIFYTAIADTHLSLVDRDYDSKDNHTMGKLSTLLEWNLQYPVMNREKVRNEVVESIQGHRNPFIDHPEYACHIWGNTNATTRRICSAYGLNGDLEVKQDNKSYSFISIEIEETLNFTATVGGSSSGTYTWEFSDEKGNPQTTSKASLNYNNNLVSLTGISKGKTYLKVTVTLPTTGSNTETLYKVIEVNVSSKIIVSQLKITRLPYTTEYMVGESLDISGLKVKAFYSDSTEVDVSDDVRVDEVKFTKSGSKTIYVYYSYKGADVSTSFKVTVFGNDDPPSPTPSSGGCGGNIATTSVIFSSLALAATILITISTKKKSKK